MNNGMHGFPEGAPANAKFQVFTTSGQFLAPPGVNGYRVESLGAGGGGSGGYKNNNSTPYPWGGAGGGGGSLGVVFLSPADIPAGTLVNVLVGAGGVGGAGTATVSSPGGSGANGGNSSFGSFVTGYGGGGASSSNSGAGAGVMGAASLNVPGGPFMYQSSNAVMGAFSGVVNDPASSGAVDGGSSAYGGAGGGAMNTSTPVSGKGGGSLYGGCGGGSGAGYNSSNVLSTSGAAGGSLLVPAWERRLVQTA